MNKIQMEDQNGDGDVESNDDIFDINNNANMNSNVT